MNREIVAIQTGTLITTDPEDVIRAIKSGKVTRFLERTHMKMMAAFSLGQRWTELANAPTLFTIMDDKIVLASGEELPIEAQEG